MPFESAGSAGQGETQEEQERRLERERQIEALREALVNLHRFSDSLNEIRRDSGDALRSNQWLVKDACAGIETLLDWDLKRLENSITRKSPSAVSRTAPTDLRSTSFEASPIASKNDPRLTSPRPAKDRVSTLAPRRVKGSEANEIASKFAERLLNFGNCCFSARLL